MKIYAQTGYGAGKKIEIGIEKNLIDGIIFDAKNYSSQKLSSELSRYIELDNKLDLLFDPQFYATFIATKNESTIGNLADWEYFQLARKSDLEISEGVAWILSKTFETIINYPTTAIIAPNIYISRSFDSIEAVISKNFIRQSKTVLNKIAKNEEREVYATLAISRETLLQKSELEDFINDITLLDNPPDGFYLIVGVSNAGASDELINSDVISGWMLLNQALAINGFKVINGYSDLLTSFLGIAGAYAGASGWWSKTREFSINNFIKRTGGSLPIVRYLSIPLMKRIKHTDMKFYEELIGDELKNKTTEDQNYSNEPDRTREVHQTWEALKYANNLFIKNSITDSFNSYKDHFKQALAKISKIDYLAGDIDSEHIYTFKDALKLFAKKLELEY